jgi:hypothetical protein
MILFSFLRSLSSKVSASNLVALSRADDLWTKGYTPWRGSTCSPENPGLRLHFSKKTDSLRLYRFPASAIMGSFFCPFRGDQDPLASIEIRYRFRIAPNFP